MCRGGEVRVRGRGGFELTTLSGLKNIEVIVRLRIKSVGARGGGAGFYPQKSQVGDRQKSGEKKNCAPSGI